MQPAKLIIAHAGLLVKSLRSSLSSRSPACFDRKRKGNLIIALVGMPDDACPVKLIIALAGLLDYERLVKLISKLARPVTHAN
jgi:xanthosine utilization system XapX-like protein